jgi:tetratricopeptide (TPR) repeat protein
MELRRALWLPLILACSSTTPKRLVIPEEMRRPLSTGQTVAEAAATSPDTISVARNRGSYDTYSITDDLSKPKSTAPLTPTVAPIATPGAPKAAAGPQKLVSPTPPTVESQRYTLRLVERGRVWEVELPESTGGYEVRIPLGPGIETPTLADQEMLGKTAAEGRSKSYLATLAKLGEMYSAHRYELALIEVVDLEHAYPKDPRLLAMKGSLYQKLGKSSLAREAWKKALEIDPSNTTIAEALRALKEE